MKFKIILIAFVAIGQFAFACQKNEEFVLATVIQSNMVIQQDKPFKLWGKASPQEIITVEADWIAKPVNTITNADGNWIAEISVPKANKGDFTPHQLLIKHGSGTIELENILIGEVWICSGQSNMEMTMLPAPPWHKGVMNYETEIPEATYPNIRLIKVKRDTSSLPTLFFEGQWEECSPETIGQFSGVAYYFGRELYKNINLPIGLVLSSYGGASCQAFTAEEVLAKDILLKSKYLDPYLAEPDSIKLTNKPSLMYNKMIYPLVNLSIKGFLWYQGESNSGDKQMYTKLCTAMLEGWRNDFKQGDLPFYFVQMTPYNWKKNDFFASNYAIFREAQEDMLKVKNTAMAVTMDVGDPDDIHPRKKKEVGLRLAKIALNQSYKLKLIQFLGPQYKSMEVKDNKIIIHYDDKSVGSGLVTKDGLAPKHFYIAGEDRVFKEATVTIATNKIILHAVNVKNPVAVRYAFFNYPITNLQNKEGFPAVPFRTDDWINPTFE